MKIINALAVCVFAFLVLCSCQKELNFEEVSGTAIGGLKFDTATHECYPSTVNGQYVVDSALDSDNFIDVQVNITATGSYNIHSDTINGYFFSGTGYVGNIGLNTIRLYGSGRPLAATPLQPDPFIIRFDTSVCIIDINVLSTVVNADYTFAGAGGTCTGAVLNGVYMQGLPMGSSNTVAVSVDVTAVGNYNISSTSNNGITFSGSGTFTTTGPQAVTLLASGTPTGAGTIPYPISGGATSCAVSVTFDPPVPPATYAFGGNPMDCTNTTFGGTYQVGTPMNSSNTVTVDVTVSVVGTYSITTANSNGVSFAGTGLFSATGAQQVTLTATGLPATGGSFDYDLLGGSTTCVIHVMYTGFSTDIFSCSIDGGATTTFLVGAGAVLNNTTNPTTLGVFGAASATGTEQMYLNIMNLTGAPITTGMYDVNMPATTIYVEGDYTDAAGIDFLGVTDGTTQPAPVFTITITTITTGTSGRVTGTFSGAVRDNSGSGPGVKMLSNGVFDLPLQ